MVPAVVCACTFKGKFYAVGEEFAQPNNPGSTGVQRSLLANILWDIVVHVVKPTSSS